METPMARWRVATIVVVTCCFIVLAGGAERRQLDGGKETNRSMTSLMTKTNERTDIAKEEKTQRAKMIDSRALEKNANNTKRSNETDGMQERGSGQGRTRRMAPDSDKPEKRKSEIEGSTRRQRNETKKEATSAGDKKLVKEAADAKKRKERSAESELNERKSAKLQKGQQKSSKDGKADSTAGDRKTQAPNRKKFKKKSTTDGASPKPTGKAKNDGDDNEETRLPEQASTSTSRMRESSGANKTEGRSKRIGETLVSLWPIRGGNVSQQDDQKETKQVKGNKQTKGQSESKSNATDSTSSHGQDGEKKNSVQTDDDPVQESVINNKTRSGSSAGSAKDASPPPEAKDDKEKKEVSNETEIEQNPNTTFTILHFNDVHSRVEPDGEFHGTCHDWALNAGKCAGGLARLKTFLRWEASKNQSMLVLNAGDDFIGTPWDHHTRGNAMAHFMNQLGVTAYVLGNHDFDYGPDVLVQYVKQLKFPVLSANMNAHGHELGNYVHRYTIVTIEGKKIGICGVTTEVTNSWSRPWPVQFEGKEWHAEQCAKDVRENEGANIVILLSHSGYRADTWLAGLTPGVDIVVGGHSHAFLWNYDSGDPPSLNRADVNAHKDHVWGKYPTMIHSHKEPGRRIPVLQAGWATRYVGKAIVAFDDNGNLISFWGQPFLMGDNGSSYVVPEDPYMKKAIQEWKWW